MFLVELVNATGGANIGRFPRATITVAANDGPHGVVEFAAASTPALEVGDDGNSTATLTVTRRLEGGVAVGKGCQWFVYCSVGFFGAVRVSYSVQSADPASLALVGGASVLSYFTTPTPNTTIATSLLLRGISADLNGCGRACLADRACLSFSIHEASSTCNLFLVIVSDSNRLPVTGFDYYQKMEEEVGHTHTHTNTHNMAYCKL